MSCRARVTLKVSPASGFFFFLKDRAPTEFSPLPLHDALPILAGPARRERQLLETALERDAGERMPGIIRGRDADHDAGVGVALRARVLAHAVGDDTAHLREIGRAHV